MVPEDHWALGNPGKYQARKMQTAPTLEKQKVLSTYPDVSS